MAQDRESETFGFKVGGTDIVQYGSTVTIYDMIISEEVKYMREALTLYNIGLVPPKFMDDLP